MSSRAIRSRRPAIVLALFCLVANAGSAATIRFRDITPESGVTFRFHDGSRGRHDLPEIMGGGVALIDADGIASI